MTEPRKSNYLVFYAYYHEDNHETSSGIVNTNVRIANVWAENSTDAENIVNEELDNVAHVLKVI